MLDQQLDLNQNLTMNFSNRRNIRKISCD